VFICAKIIISKSDCLNISFWWGKSVRKSMGGISGAFSQEEIVKRFKQLVRPSRSMVASDDLFSGEI